MISSLFYKFCALKPKPSPYPLIRIGPLSDGGYLIPDDLKNISACFSPGNDNRKPFEDYLLHNYGITSFLLDKSSDPEKFETPLFPGQFFYKLWLSHSTSEDSITLSNWLADADISCNNDLILQMDIEGAEWDILSSSSTQDLSRFRIIVVEFHGLGDLLDPEKLSGNYAQAILNLAANHTCVHVHPNNTGTEIMIPGTSINLPTILECTFLRNDRFDLDLLEAQSFDLVLPHPLDRSCSTKYPDLPLTPAWSKYTETFSRRSVFTSTLSHRWRILKRKFMPF